MTVDLLRLLFDFGLLILIWLVQLVIYPGFQYYSKENLITWHRKYTFGISLVVIPLMFGQLITATLQLFEEISSYTAISMVLIVCVWSSTFVQFVPLHNKIAKGLADKALLNRLVQRNWSRTIIWSSLLIFSVSKNLF